MGVERIARSICETERSASHLHVRKKTGICLAQRATFWLRADREGSLSARSADPNPAVVERSETNARPSATSVASMYAKNQNVPREASHILV